ncbi:CoA transferase [bacterium]|nr:CoA transferase [bacterium]
MSTLPLQNIRILDLTGLLPGPLCTMMLAEMGAEVIKVERPETGDLIRHMSPLLYAYLNGKKQVVQADLKSENGIRYIKETVRNSAVFVEGFRPGVVKKLGIDFDNLVLENPSLIYCSISGYGQTGPNAGVPGHDINYQSITGLFSICGDPDGGPEFPSGIQTADIAGSMYALTSILAALHQPKNAPARFLDISIANAMSMWMMPRYLEYLTRNKPPKAELMGRGAYGTFLTRDGRYLCLGVVEHHFWINLCKKLKLDDLLQDESLVGWTAINARRQEIMPRLQQLFLKQDLDYWLRELKDADVPVSAVRDIGDWTHDPQFKHNNFIPHHKDGTIDQSAFRRFPVDLAI